MIFYYNPVISGRTQVILRCDEEQDFPQFEFINYNPTIEELDLINQNYDLFIENGILLIEKPQKIKDIEALQEKDLQIEESRQKILELEQKINDLITLMQN